MQKRFFMFVTICALLLSACGVRFDTGSGAQPTAAPQAGLPSAAPTTPSLAPDQMTAAPTSAPRPTLAPATALPSAAGASATQTSVAATSATTSSFALPTDITAATPAATTAASSGLSPFISAPISETVEVPRVLEAKWYQDSDDNAIPDFLETELGYDPLKDDCPQKQCGEGAEGSDFFGKERNALLMLDSSGSMAAQSGGERKIDAAKASLLRYVRATSTLFKLGFLVYGHKGNNTEAGKAESCAGIDILSPIGQTQPDTFKSVLDQFQPTGWTPIAAALTKAQEAFAGKEGQNNRIVMVSDGIETCGGDPVAVAKQLHDQGLAVEIDVIGFDIKNADEQAALQRIAEVTGGSYYEARNRAELDAYFKQQLEALNKSYEDASCEADNYTTLALCNTELVTRALEYTKDLQLKEPDAYSEKFAAYSAVLHNIVAKSEQRQELYRQAIERHNRLSKQFFEILEQSIAAYDSTQ